jgi:hypothetical protein
MAEIEFLLPTVQYGNVKVRATPEELGIDSAADAAAIGTAYAVYLNAFQQGFKRGAAIDVDIDPTPAVASPQAATQRLDENLKPRTVDEANEMAKQVIERELGATTAVEEYENEAAIQAAPWNSTVDASPKPWETGSAPVKVAEIDWS